MGPLVLDHRFRRLMEALLRTAEELYAARGLLSLAALLPIFAAACAHVAGRADGRTEVVQAIAQHLVDEYGDAVAFRD